MNRPSAGVVLLAVIASIASGCSGRMHRALEPNRPPTVVWDPVRLMERGETERTYSLRWKGDDADGHVREYVFALDPASPDRVDASWEHSTSNERVVRVGEPGPGSAPHRFVVRAIDDLGALSAPASVVLADNLPPTVVFTCPTPARSATITVPPSVTFHWAGDDPDGIISSHRPVAYKVIFLGPANDWWIPGGIEGIRASNGASLWHASAPDFPESQGWVRVGGDTTSVDITNLFPGATFLIAVVAIDEWGAYTDSTATNLNTNIIVMRATLDSTSTSPLLTMTGPGFTYTFAYPAVGVVDDAAHHVPLEIAGSSPVFLSWVAAAAIGSCGVSYRWALDPVSLDDPTPRSDPSDLHHWSEWGGSASYALGPFDTPSPPKRSVHSLYVEARDFGGTSLGVLDLVTVPQGFAKDLLFVNDTRKETDQFLADGSLRPRQLPWPSAAELDTFLFARGGVPWDYYPPGTLSEPGLFAGYEFDTLGTRSLTTVSFVPLSTLSQYHYVVWFVDLASATNVNPPGVPNPITALRSMSSPGQRQALEAYVAMGGHLWLAGGGAACANLLPYNVASNDGGAGRYTFTTPQDLSAARFMFSTVLWQSQIRGVLASNRLVSRFTGRHEGSGLYATLPAALEAKTPATDPLPPLRTSAQFYLTNRNLEAITLDNLVYDAEGNSALDTLMNVSGSLAPFPPGSVAMTCTPAGGRVVFSGFDFWSWRRTECAQLADFVLHDLWGLSRTPAPPPAGAAAVRRPRR